MKTVHPSWDGYKRFENNLPPSISFPPTLAEEVSSERQLSDTLQAGDLCFWLVRFQSAGWGSCGSSVHLRHASDLQMKRRSVSAYKNNKLVLCSSGRAADQPFVMSVPWLSWENNAECWAATPSPWGLESSSMKTGGGGGGGGQGALWAGEESKREAGAIGPCERKEVKVRITFSFFILSCSTEYVQQGEYCIENIWD